MCGPLKGTSCWYIMKGEQLCLGNRLLNYIAMDCFDCLIIVSVFFFVKRICDAHHDLTFSSSNFCLFNCQMSKIIKSLALVDKL